MFPAAAPRSLSRRRALAVAGLGLLAGPVLAACSGTAAARRPDPLVPLAERARADVALVTAAITADPALAGRLDQLRSARADHADALEKEIARLKGAAATATPAPAPAPPPGAASLAAVRTAAEAAAKEASDLVIGMSADRIALVAAVAACCATYSVVLGNPA